MDYKYIEQLLERYWHCETSLQEEKILRTFFSQENVPVGLVSYKDLFIYEHSEKDTVKLNDDFDKKILSIINEKPVKACIITIHQRFMPLFKAAAIVAIILTLGNAIQNTFTENTTQNVSNTARINKTQEGPSVAKADSTKTDSLQHNTPAEAPIIK